MKTNTRKKVGAVEIKEPRESKPAEYKMVLTIADTKIESTGVTALSALMNLERPIEIVADGFLTMTIGERKAERYLTPTQIKRLFYPNAQLYAAEELMSLLK